jgi:hypothetical protein
MRAILAQARFAALPAVQVVAIATFFPGGGWLWLGAALIVSVVFLDEMSGDYRAPVDGPNTVFLEGALHAVVPLMALLTIGLVLLAAAPGSPAAAFARALGMTHPADSWIAIAGAVVTVGLIGGPAAGAFGHELMHRSNRLEWFLGQLLLLNCLNTALALEHVHGHHRDVGTPADVATVPRGMSFWRYLPRAIVGIRVGAARIEVARMRRRRLPWFALQNRFLQGVGLELSVVTAILALAGPMALAAFLASAAIGVLLIELANYIGHYGLVRVPGQPVMPRHSWNGPRFLSTSVTVNLPRHSHHHVRAGTPYWDLRVLDDAPILPFGLTVMSMIALVPPLYFRVIGPRLEDWDRRLASAEELALLSRRAPMIVGAGTVPIAGGRT